MKKLIIWKNIQSIEYILEENLMKIFHANATLDKNLEIAKVTFLTEFPNLQEHSIQLSSLYKYSGRFAFEQIEQQYHKTTGKRKIQSKPELNEVIYYNNLMRPSSISAMLYSFISIITNPLYLPVFIQVLLSTNTINKRKIAVNTTQQGIQDEWLYKNQKIIPWCEIKSIQILNSPSLIESLTSVKEAPKNEKFLDNELSFRLLWIELKNDEAYLQYCTFWQKILVKYARPKTHPLFFIAEHISKYSLDDLDTMLTEEWQKHIKH